MGIKKYNSGSVSMFVVIMTSTLIVIMASSFVKLMNRDQQRATEQDLSQSAYDSAQAGVEDAKRFIAKYSAECGRGLRLDTRECIDMQNALNKSDSCNMLNSGNIGAKEGETQIQTSASSSSRDSQLNQAYTCVKMQYDTDDFLGKSSTQQSKMIPLKGNRDFRYVRISWHNVNNMSKPDESINLPEVTGHPSRIQTESLSDWQKDATRPAMLKTQFFGYKNSRNMLEKMDTSFSDDGEGLDEALLMPTDPKSTSANSRFNLPNNRRDNPTKLEYLYPVSCNKNLLAGGYACMVTIDLNHNVLTGDNAFLRLLPIYRDTDFKIELLDERQRIVKFNGVQPKVDSTGRANDRFRRVESRLEFNDSNIPVPDFAVESEDTSQPFCKSFWVSHLKNGGWECKL